MDMKKVIKGLRCIKGDTIPCRECGYADEDGHGNYSCKINCAIDAIAILNEQQEQIDRLLEESASNAEMAEGLKELLKEHDPVKPRVSSVEQRCGNCNKIIEMDGWKACPWCGKPIDWESWWREHETYRRR